MVQSTAASGYGVIAALGLVPIATGMVLGNTSGSTAFPTAISIGSVPLGNATATTMAIGGATIGTNALAVTGTANISGVTTAGTMISGDGRFIGASATTLNLSTNGQAQFSNNAATNLFILSAPSAAATPKMQLGALDAAAPVAQTLSVQSVVTGTSNIAGVDFTVIGSRGTGTGAGGAIAFQVAPASTTGSTPNALITAFKIGPSGSVSVGSSNSAAIALRITGLGATTGNSLFVTDSGGNSNLNVLDNGSALIGRNAPATNATAGFVYIPVCAGTPTGAPTAQSGYVPIQFDSTNSQFWIFTGAAWKQPKTPAGAATVTWQ